MIKNNVCVVGLGLGGERVAYGFQQKNYSTYLVNGSKQDNKTLTNARNVLVLEGYDGLAGDRNLAFEALKNNKEILRKMQKIEEKVILLCATGGGTTGSGSITHLANICCSMEDKIVCAVLMMPRQDEPIQKRLNAYNAAKELMEIEDMGATILINNESYDDLEKINFHVVNMLDAFFSDDSFSTENNFDDSEKYKMLGDNGVFVISMKCDKDGKTTTQDVIDSLTCKNVFLPINSDGICSHIGIINQKGNRMDEHEIVKAVGNPENIYMGNNGHVNIICVSGLSFPVEYITRLGQSAVKEQKERRDKRKALTLLDDLEDIEIVEETKAKKCNKRRQMSLDLLREL
jgi:hypothetical protein